MSNGTPSTIWRERLASPLTWHYAGFAALLLLVISLSIRLGMDWAATDSHANEVLTSKHLQLEAMELQTAPLRGLDKKVDQTREQMHAFYEKRIPPDYSSISARVEELGVASGVRLTREQYTQGLSGPDLTEISMDATISGEYPQIMHFINGLERDQTFFLIRSMGLTGQQGGQVNLRLGVSTWLRRAAAEASGLPQTPHPGATPAEPAAGSPAAAGAEVQ